ncbi:MAG: A/G-specific adenine glycosylase, partial [uncultured Acidimicrobiales bacterium]
EGHPGFAHGMGRGRPEGPAMAADPRPLGGPGQRAHAAADAGGAGRPPLRGVPGPVPHAGSNGVGASGRGGAGLGRARLQPPRGEPPPGRGRDRPSPRWRPPRDADRPGGPSRRRRLHGPGGAGFRLRGRRRRGGGEQRPGAGSGRRRPSPRRSRGPGHGGRPRSRWRGMGVEPGDARPGRHGVHEVGAGLPGVPTAGVLRLGRDRRVGRRSRDRLGRLRRRPVDLRRLRPPGSRPPGRRPPAGPGAPVRAGRGCRVAGRSGAGGAGGPRAGGRRAGCDGGGHAPPTGM